MPHGRAGPGALDDIDDGDGIMEENRRLVGHGQLDRFVWIARYDPSMLLLASV